MRAHDPAQVAAVRSRFEAGGSDVPGSDRRSDVTDRSRHGGRVWVPNHSCAGLSRRSCRGRISFFEAETALPCVGWA